ncbi:MAG: ATP-dependent Clp protease adaptor ClpS [Alphaproteobacteria bacterium]
MIMIAVQSPHLKETLQRALASANARRHEFATLEHMLLALTEDQDAVAVMRGCRVDIDLLRQEVTHYIDTGLQDLVYPGPEKAPVGILRRLINAASKSNEAGQSGRFCRALQRAQINRQNSGHKEVTGANVLAELLTERESKAVALLEVQGMTRFDALRFISHGVVKGGESNLVAPQGVSDSTRCTVKLLNDDYTPMDFVVRILEKIFDKSRKDAAQLMLQIHRTGMAICGIYPCSIAMAKINIVMDDARKNEHPLQCTMEKE